LLLTLDLGTVASGLCYGPVELADGVGDGELWVGDGVDGVGDGVDCATT
jgi:hypothetical protein